MDLQQLKNMIESTIEEPPCFIDYVRRNGFAWYENGVLKATPGTAVALNGHEPFGDLEDQLVDRRVRAAIIGCEYHYLMHFEQALNALFAGDIRMYNEISGYIDLPKIPVSDLPRITDENWDILWRAMK